MKDLPKNTNAMRLPSLDGVVLHEASQFKSLAARLDAALTAQPMSTVELNELGNRFFLGQSYEAARICFERASADERAMGALINLARCDIQLGHLDEAEVQARQLLAKSPMLVPGWQLLSEVLMSKRQFPAAVQALRKAAAIAPMHAMVQAQLGRACDQVGDVEAARVAYGHAVALNPNDARSLASLLYHKRNQCDWHKLDSLSERLRQFVKKGTAGAMPFEFLAEGATAAEELACARAAAPVIENAGQAGAMPSQPRSRGPLRVGFLSWGFGKHPVTALTMQLFELLRERNVEVHLFATSSGGDASPERRRLRAAAKQWHEVAGLTPTAMADCVRKAGIEIFFEMDGYCNHQRPSVSALRPAPIQVNWLGYPGTFGADYMDYVIADPFVLPYALHASFAEKVVYLPRCYLSTDTTRIVVNPPARAACGLPETPAVVYACFNATFKLNPRSFARMMRILAAVPGSVLWLLNGKGGGMERLRASAQTMGVASDRLIFLQRLPNAAYLARYRHADLFLDTENYGAHTTASDALWAGCPVLTRPGETFATRVAGSLNHYLGMLEMNVCTDDEFVAMAVRYGREPQYRMDLRAKLERQHKHAGLFDMQSYAKDFASLLTRMAEHHRAGGRPHAFQQSGSLEEQGYEVLP